MFDVELRCAGIHYSVSGCVEREISEAVSVDVVRRRAWKREAECPIEAVLDDVRVEGS